MPAEALNILLVNGGADVEQRVRQALQDDGNWSLTTAGVARPDALLPLLLAPAPEAAPPDALLLDTRDGRITPAALAEALAEAPTPALPILLIYDDETDADAPGPHDALPAAELQPRLLRHALYSAIERARLQRRLQRALFASESETRQHLAHLQAVYAAAPVGLAFTDLEHRYVIVNERLAAYSGFSVEEMLGRRVDELRPGPIGERALACCQAVLETGRPVYNTELQVAGRAAPDIARSWSGRYFPVYDADGQLMGVNVVIMEITEQKRLEENLEAQVRARTAQARKLAADLTLAEQRERRRIAGILHDDIQQKLYALQVHIHMLEQAIALGGPPDGGEARTAVIGRLIDELIEDNSRLSVELSPPTIAQEGLIEALGWLRQYLRQQYGLRVSLQRAGDLTIKDRDLREVIFQMVRELLLNVALHSGVAEASLTLRREGDRLHIHVADEGAGFDPQEQFANAAEEMSFGLRTLRERVESFGGALHVDAHPGAGARITITMPVEKL